MLSCNFNFKYKLIIVLTSILFISGKAKNRKERILNLPICNQSTLLIRTGWDYSTNSYFQSGAPDPYWHVTRDDNASTIEPRPANVDFYSFTSSGGPGSLNSGHFTAIANNWCCQTYTSTCGQIPSTPCSYNNAFGGQFSYAPYTNSVQPDEARVFSYTFCIDPNANLSTIQMSFQFKADDYAKICLNGNYIGNNSTCNSQCTINNFFQHGVNVIDISLYNTGGSQTYIWFDGSLTTTNGSSPFINPNCCSQAKTITGQKFLDSNGNGIKDNGEGTLPNWPIILKDLSNNIIATTTTDLYGNYFFMNLPSGNYIVEEGMTSGFFQTAPSSGSYPINLTTSSYTTNINFGNKNGGPCTSANFNMPNGNLCTGPISFSAIPCPNPNAVYLWSFSNGSNATGLTTSNIFPNPGTYTVTLTITSNQSVTATHTQTISIQTCQPPQACSNCIGSFAPDPGEYVLSLWVREDISPQPITYNNARVQISFTGNNAVHNFLPNPIKNKVIEGWQRIEEPFNIPVGATHINLKLWNAGGTGAPDVFFDDIRVFPKDGQIKTYVYDPLSMRLSAVLDENNYATFYEYDEEGKLIRIKKETEKGIMTIQESREGLKKQ